MAERLSDLLAPRRPRGRWAEELAAPAASPVQRREFAVDRAQRVAPGQASVGNASQHFAELDTVDPTARMALGMGLGQTMPETARMYSQATDAAGFSGGTRLIRAPFEMIPASGFSGIDTPDEFLYHVTSAPNAQRILQSGLRPRTTPRGLVSGSVYDQYGQGKAFLTERAGVPFWQERIEAHLFDRFDDPPDIATLRLPRSIIEQLLQPDALGTRDARAPAYFVTRPIGPQR